MAFPEAATDKPKSINDYFMENGGALSGMFTKGAQFAFERFRRASPLETLTRPAAIMRVYFQVAPDEEEATRRLKQSPHLDHQAWEKAVFEDYGGVLQLGPVIVSIANRTKVPATIVDIRSRVVARRTQDFAAKHDPPIGGPFGIVHLWFDLDQDLSPGVLVDPNSASGFTPQNHGGYSFLSTQNLVVPGGGEPLQIGVFPESRQPVVIDWVLDYTYIIKNWRNRMKRRTATIDLQGQPFTGVSSTVTTPVRLWLGQDRPL